MWTTTGYSFSPCTGAFAEGFDFITLITLLPYYINALDPSATTVLGVTVGVGFVIGTYASSFEFRDTRLSARQRDHAASGRLTTAVSVASVFYVGGAFAITGVGTFLVILVRFHGAATLTER